MRLRIGTTPIALSLVLLAYPGGGGLVGQTKIQLRPGVSCAQCTIVAERMAVINDETTTGEALDGMPFSMVRAPDGRVYLISARFRPMVFIPAEEHLQLFGRPGGGPGEFSTPSRFFVTESGRIVLLDPPLQRLTTFDGRSHPVSASRVPGTLVTEAILAGDSTLVYNASFNTPDAIGRPFHVIGADGGVALSFGPEIDIRRPADAAKMRYRLTSSRVGRFWAARELRYELTEWTVSGDPLRIITRDASWFPNAEEYAAAAPRRPFTPFVTAVHQDQKNRIWLLVAVPAQNFASGLGDPVRGSDGVTRYPISSHRRHYDTVVEVIDLASSSVVASLRLPGYFAFFLDDSHIASYDEDENGSPSVEIWRLSPHGETGSGGLSGR